MFVIALCLEQVLQMAGLIEEAQAKQGYNWVCKIALRDLAVALTVIGVWYWWVDVYNKKDFKQLKFDSNYVPEGTLWREVPGTISTILMGTLCECLIMHYFYSNKSYDNYYMNLMDHPFLSFFWIAGMPWH